MYPHREGLEGGCTMQEEDGHVGSGLFATQVSLNMHVACYCRVGLQDRESHGSHKYNDSYPLYDV